MNMPRILLGAAASGSGKTMITCGILQALVNRGLKVSSFKCGPDYIDPMFHTKVIGTRSRNLDTFFTGENLTNYLLAKNAAGTDISVMEGVMGYYDGLGGISTEASAYDLARVTRTPAVLIVNTKGMSLSVLAQIKGFLEYRENSQIQGVILNQMSPMIYQEVRQLIEEQLPVKVYGYVPVIRDFVLESRHLGLVMPEEVEGLSRKVKGLAAVMEESLDLDGLIRLAQTAPEPVYEKPEIPRAFDIDQELKETQESRKLQETQISREQNELRMLREPQEYPVSYVSGEYQDSCQKPAVTIAGARDSAFCFYYQDNLDLLAKMGAELVEFSPIKDSRLPEHADGLLLGGGYPELFAKELSENTSMLESIRQAVGRGMPLMAECGGFMYLHNRMEGMDGVSYPMAGVIDGEVYRTEKLGRFGYIELTANEDQMAAAAGETVRGHEFHYFDSTSCGGSFLARKPLRKRSWNCIHGTETMTAGFPHLHYYSNMKIPFGFIRRCGEYRKAKNNM